MGWVKGQSGNPKGRRKVNAAFEKAVEKAAKGRLETIKYLAEFAEDEGIRLKAATWLLERAYGKTPEEMNLEASGPLVAVIKEG